MLKNISVNQFTRPNFQRKLGRASQRKLARSEATK